MESIVIISFATIVALISTSQIKRIAIKYGIGELPNERKIHAGFIPHLGGLGIYLGGLVGMLVAILWKDYYWQMFTLKYVGILTAATLMLIIGILDDTRNINAAIKFAVQFIASTIVIFSGCRVETIINPFGQPIQLGIFSIPITYLWLIGVTNAINLMDGLDGLASGVGLAALSTFGIISFQQQDWMTFGICLAVIGGILGFLRYNYHPASIFMGDTGSLFIGFLLASIALQGLQKSEGNIALLVPIITLALPIGDTSLAFFRRLYRGQHPFRADKDHLHHRLLSLGLSHRQAVHIIYLFSLLFGLAAYLMSTESRFYGIILLFIIFSIAIFSLFRLGYLESQKIKTYLGDQKVIRVKQEMAPLSMRRFWHKTILVFSDIIMINLAFIVTHWLKFNSGLFSNDQTLTLQNYLESDVPLIFTTLFILLFALNGLYVMSWDVSRFDKFMRVSRVVLFGIAIIFLITFEPNFFLSFSSLCIIIYFITLVFFINSGRLIVIYLEKKFSILEYSLHNTILVGGGDKAINIYKIIQNNSHFLYNIVGVVAKEKPKAYLDELKYLGTYEKIPSIIRKKGVEEIIIAINERSRDEILDIVALGENMRVTFKILPQMYDVVSGHKTEEVLGHPLIKLFPEQLRPWQWIVKRLIDITVAVSGIIVLLPLYLCILLSLMFSGIYPFLIIENRVGRQGKIFGILQFNVSKTESKICRLLLNSRLYRIPQIINLLLGSLSLVGPIPESKDEVEVLRKRIKFYNRRLMVRPGITGWAQLKYRYSESFKQKKEQFKQDIYYLEHMSISFDFRILLRSLLLFFLRK